MGKCVSVGCISQFGAGTGAEPECCRNAMEPSTTSRSRPLTSTPWQPLPRLRRAKRPPSLFILPIRLLRSTTTSMEDLPSKFRIDALRMALCVHAFSRLTNHAPGTWAAASTAAYMTPAILCQMSEASAKTSLKPSRSSMCQ
ncbi:glycoside hydrolase family 51 protein [Alternaria alternata]|nr:glycoside hydrolase family 51 protein [Alternaria alternata]